MDRTCTFKIVDKDNIEGIGAATPDIYLVDLNQQWQP